MPGGARTVMDMSSSVDIFREFVEELRAACPHGLALVLGSFGSLILPLAGIADGAVSCANIDAPLRV